MTMNTAQHRKQLQLGLNAIFGFNYKNHATQWTEIFDTENSTKNYEEDVLMAGFGAAGTKAQGAAIAYDDGGEAWTATYKHITVALAFALTQEAEEDGLYGSLGKKYAMALARSMQYTKEVHGANTLNNGFDSSYLGGDGVCLFSTAHPLVGGGTYANKLSTAADFSETALEDACIAIDGFTDERGIPILAKVKKLIVPRQLRFEADRVLSTKNRTGTADNDINAVYHTGAVSGGYTVNHFLTDPDAWFLKTDCPDGLKHFSRVALQRGMEGDFETGNIRYKARERYSFGWTDPRGAFASEGA